MYKCVLNLVTKISLMFAQYFEYYAIILRGAVFLWTQCILRQSRRDPGIGILPILTPGIEKSTPRLQSQFGIRAAEGRFLGSTF